MRSCNYPVYTEVPNGEYYVYRRPICATSGAGEQIFRGYAYDPSGIAQVDLAEIAKNDIESPDVFFPEDLSGEDAIIVSRDIGRELRCIATNGSGGWIVGGSGYYGYSTDDLETITYIDAGLNVSVSVEYGNGVFCMTRRQINSTATSIIRFTEVGADFDVVYTSTGGIGIIRYINGIWACGRSTNGYAYSTTNGASFNNGAFGTSLSGLATDVAYFNGRYFFSSPNGFITHSSSITSSSWNLLQVDEDGAGWRTICGRYGDILVLGGLGDRVNMAYSSVGSSAWTTFEVGAQAWNKIILGDRFFAIGARGYIATSNNGVSWQMETVGTENIWDVVYVESQGKYVMCSGNDIIEYTPGVDGGYYVQELGSGAQYSSNNSTFYAIVYDYNTNYISDLGDFRLCNDPIRKEVYAGQIVPLSYFGKCGSTTTVEVGSESIPVDAGGLFNLWTIAPDTIGDTLRYDITIDGDTDFIEYTIVNHCDIRYVLYYINKYGGLDWLIMKGNDPESYQNTPYDINTNYDRTFPDEFQRKRIQNIASRRWALNTGFLSDEQSERMDHLMLSTKVWLYDIEDDERRAVLIRDTTFTIKKYKDNRTYTNYTINIEQSQDVIRK